MPAQSYEAGEVTGTGEGARLCFLSLREKVKSGFGDSWGLFVFGPCDLDLRSSVGGLARKYRGPPDTTDSWRCPGYQKALLGHRGLFRDTRGGDEGRDKGGDPAAPAPEVNLGAVSPDQVRKLPGSGRLLLDFAWCAGGFG